MVLSRKDRRWQELTKDSFELLELARHFELYNRTEGKSPKTIRWYNLSIQQFYRFLTEMEKSTKLADLNEGVVRQFILYLQEKTRWQDNPYIPKKEGKLAAISIQTYIRGLRAFFNWLYKQHYTIENRLANLKPPKAQSKLVETLTEGEIKAILSCVDTRTTAGYRDHAILLLLLDTGLRSSELVSLRSDDVNIDAGYLKVMGKGGKERIVPFGVMAQRALLRYVANSRLVPLLPDTGSFFLTLEGLPLTRNSLKMMFQRLGTKCGIKRLHPHLCRHTFATNYLVNGGDVFTLQHILGHTSLEMVRTYVSLASAHVTVQHRKFSPMDRISSHNLSSHRLESKLMNNQYSETIPGRLPSKSYTGK
jgi:site-specific recombinase XerD